MICDSHGHLQMLSEAERSAAIARARDAGVGKILVPGTTLEDSRRAVEVAEAHEGVVAAVGIHPHEAKDFDEDRVLEAFDALLRSPKAVAVGEIGLDFHYDHSPRPAQIRALRSQLAFARERGLPVLLHNRESGTEMLEALAAEPRRPDPGVFHSFTEDAAYGERAIALGYRISFSGMLTFKAAENIRAAARALPLASMLVETDSPFLAPEPHRGKRCEPAFVVETARRLALVKEVPLEEVAAATTSNFDALFVRRSP
ncbi:MAG TPA: TatD family hydrolase [Thermoanaerobaculia bacterium]|jgi:TatD DNase family protein|nr:TatD family hydrolase [Thermoanaerobaculia bacterium]